MGKQRQYLGSHKYIITIFFNCWIVLLFCNVCFSQIAANPQTTTPSSSRFEIIKSPTVASWTFRLDKFTGKVYQLVFPENEGRLSWQEMRIDELPKITAVKPVFQIFISNEDVRQTFLLNTENGQAWFLANARAAGSEQTILMWIKFPVEK